MDKQSKKLIVNIIYLFSGVVLLSILSQIISCTFLISKENTILYNIGEKGCAKEIKNIFTFSFNK
tara:strand:+ start:199 stop:393 length:195 start_codon:yes stop_codon:yes gene_type:complete